MGFTTKCKFLVLVPVILLLIAASPSLSAATETNQTTAQSIRRSVELEFLHKAQKAFDSGDLEKAQNEFAMLSELAKNSDIRQEALYGLAATKLVLADSEDSYNSAVATWEKWAEEAKSSKGMEDPRMITPFLLRLQAAIKKGAGGPLGQKAKNDNSPRIVIMKEKVVEALRAKLDLAEREIQKLRHDIKSLNAIHRKYEEKKQEMTQ
ncbi:MAG: hypothetical protein M0Z81_04310 [Deltaproteobacteria bacterium]|jgi:hypothetical protein|nr:hypothetical protein [Deltaproteobacteria bacterium]